MNTLFGFRTAGIALGALATLALAQPGRIHLDPNEGPPREPLRPAPPGAQPRFGPDGGPDRLDAARRSWPGREWSTLEGADTAALNRILARARARYPNPVDRLAALRAAAKQGKISLVGPEDDDLPPGVPPAPGSISADPAVADRIFRLAERSVRGDFQPFIWRGSPTDRFPDCVSVGCDGHWSCSGVLIAPNAVLTARHCCGVGRACEPLGVAFCEAGPDGRCVVGTGPFAALGPKPWVDHPFGPRGRVVICGEETQNDLRVLILREPVTHGVRPAPWASAEEIEAAEEVTVAGFGSDEDSRVPGHVRQKRAAVVTRLRGSCTAEQQDDDVCFMQWEFLASDPVERRDTCNGDSGGPAYIVVGGKVKLAGITSRRMPRRGNEPCGDGGVYTRVIKYREWLEGLKDDQGKPLIHWSDPPPWAQ